MSKNLKNGGLDQYGPERFGRLILLQSEKCRTERVNTQLLHSSVTLCASFWHCYMPSRASLTTGRSDAAPSFSRRKAVSDVMLESGKIQQHILNGQSTMTYSIMVLHDHVPHRIPTIIFSSHVHLSYTKSCKQPTLSISYPNTAKPT